MATCKDCIHEIACGQDEVFKYGAYECTQFKNKADFVEVVRCHKCKFGDVSCHALTTDGEKTIANYCFLKGRATSIDYYCGDGQRK